MRNVILPYALGHWNKPGCHIPVLDSEGQDPKVSISKYNIIHNQVLIITVPFLRVLYLLSFVFTKFRITYNNFVLIKEFVNVSIRNI